MRVYLSGPMTGIENYNFPEFFRIAKLLREQDYEVVSPAEEDIKKGWVLVEFRTAPDRWAMQSWLTCGLSYGASACPTLDDYEHRFTTTPTFDYEQALEHDCALADESDGIVLMPGWEQSNGARRELREALDAYKAAFVWEEGPGAREISHETARELLRKAQSARAEDGSPRRKSLKEITDIAESVYRPLVREANKQRDEAAKELYELRSKLGVRGAPKVLRTPEQHEVIGVFTDLLMAATGDGGAKRAAGQKPSWKVDDSHEGAIFSHITKWKRGEKVDADSGVHPLVHAAWRCLAIAARESAENGLIPDAPDGARLEYG